MSAPTPEFVLGYRAMMLDGVGRELEITKRVLAAIPEGKRDYRPDPHARTAWELAWHLANTDVQFLDAIADLKFVMPPPAPADKPNTVAELVDWYDRNVKRSAERVHAMSADQLLTPVQFFVFNFPAAFYLGFLEQPQHSSSGRVGYVSASDGIEGAFDLWRKLRRAVSGSGISQRGSIVPLLPNPCASEFSRPAGRLFLVTSFSVATKQEPGLR